MSTEGEVVVGAGFSRPWLLADGVGWMDMVLLDGSEVDLAHAMIQAKRAKAPLTLDQWWDANLHETRVLVRWGPATDHGGVEHLLDGGVVVTYPDGRRSV